METLHTLALVVHIISGFTALLTGTAILVLRKGGKFHRRSGLVYFIALMAVAASSFVMSVIHPNPFLFMIGLFTLYLGLSGYRAVKDRLRHTGAWDLLITLMGAGNAVAMLINGHVVLMVFGGLSAYLVFGDIRTYVYTLRHLPVPKLLWLKRHIGHMLGSYIATVTAFLVVNFSSSPLGIMIWFAPMVVVVPLIFIWTQRYVTRPQARVEQSAA